MNIPAYALAKIIEDPKPKDANLIPGISADFESN
jgi:hypothetical protein